MRLLVQPRHFTNTRLHGTDRTPLNRRNASREFQAVADGRAVRPALDMSVGVSECAERHDSFHRSAATENVMSSLSFTATAPPTEMGLMPNSVCRTLKRPFALSK